MEEWAENHGKANLRPSTFEGYKGNIRNHIVPYIGHVQLNQLTPAMLDNMFQHHKALHPQKSNSEKDASNKDAPKKTKKKSSDIEL